MCFNCSNRQSTLIKFDVGRPEHGMVFVQQYYYDQRLIRLFYAGWKHCYPCKFRKLQKYFGYYYLDIKIERLKMTKDLVFREEKISNELSTGC